MTERTVRIERRDAVGILTVDRQEAMNALNMQTLLALEAGLGEFEGDRTVGAIVVTGAGSRAFAAGGDIVELNSRQGLAHYGEYGELLHRVFRRFETCDKPTIAAVNGWALGGGTELMLCLDLRIAADDCKLGLPEINLGLFPGAGGSQRMIRQISPCRARELMFCGDPITAVQALEWGLVNRLVARDRVLEEAVAMAARIAARSAIALKIMKRALVQGSEMPPAAALRHEQALIGLLLDSHDAHEGCTAFLEKRPARFEGR
jgi:enoyl-CoA hydratase